MPPAASLAESFRQHDLPVVLVNVTGLDTVLRDLGVTQVHSLKRIFPKRGETATSTEIIEFLDRSHR